MIFEKSTTFAIRCSDCGYIDLEQINIFQLSGRQSHDIICECGNKKASIKRKNSKEILINYYCLVCDCEHQLTILGKSFWSTKREYLLYCDKTDLNLGYFGDYKLIKEKISRQKKEMDALASELGFEDFSNPEIMLEILDYLHDLADKGNLGCDCGSFDININLSSDNLKLFCGCCANFVIIPASGRDHLRELKNFEELFLTGKSILIQDIKQNKFNPWINIKE